MKQKQIQTNTELSLTYRPEIDGLRAFAVIPVILFHLGMIACKGGFIGVDIFFVISGYLMSSIIQKDVAARNFTLHRFWIRRVRRIIPALLAMLFVTSVVGLFTLFWPRINELGLHGLSAIFSITNVVLFLKSGSYWGDSAENSFFLHTWSLSVEEQFYLILPLIFVFLLTRHSSKTKGILALIFLLSLTMSIWATMYKPSAGFYFLPTRMWELLAGVLLSLSAQRVQNVSPPIAKTVGTLGFFAIILSYLFISGESMKPGIMLIPVIGAVAVIAFSNHDSWVKKILTLKPIIFIGKTSYSLYLWHWPVIVFSNTYESVTSKSVSLSFQWGVIIVLSMLSYFYIEQKSRHSKRVLPWLAGMIVCYVGFSTYLFQKPVADISTLFNPVHWKGNLYNVNPDGSWSDDIKQRMSGILAPMQPDSCQSSYNKRGILFFYGDSVPEIVVLGDSHGLMWAPVLDQIAMEIRTTISFFTADGTPVFFPVPVVKGENTLFFTADEKVTFDSTRLESIRKWKPKVVVIVTRWSHLENAESSDDLLKEIVACGSTPIIMEQPPELKCGDINLPRYLSYLHAPVSDSVKFLLPAVIDETRSHGEQIIQTILKNYPTSKLVKTADLFYNDTRDSSIVLEGKEVLYIDDDHLSLKGTLRVKDRIKTMLLELTHSTVLPL